MVKTIAVRDCGVARSVTVSSVRASRVRLYCPAICDLMYLHRQAGFLLSFTRRFRASHLEGLGA